MLSLALFIKNFSEGHITAAYCITVAEDIREGVLFFCK